MRKRIKAVSDSDSDNYSSDDEDYIPVDSGVSLKEINKNLKEFNKNFNKNTFWNNIIWYIKCIIIIFSQMMIAIYCCNYLYSIINPNVINFYKIFVILTTITIITTIQISIKYYYKKMII